MGVTLPEVRVDPYAGGPLARNRQHLPAQLDAGQLGASRVMLQIPSGADCYLEHVAVRLRSRPLAAGREEHPVVDRHFAVVPLRAVVLDRPDALGLVPRR